MDSLTRSWNDKELALNPVVFMFARLLPTTPMAVLLAFKAERAVEKEVDIISPKWLWLIYSVKLMSWTRKPRPPPVQLRTPARLSRSRRDPCGSGLVPA